MKRGNGEGLLRVVFRRVQAAFNAFEKPLDVGQAGKNAVTDDFRIDGFVIVPPAMLDEAGHIPASPCKNLYPQVKR